MAWVAFHKFKEGQMDGGATGKNLPVDFEGDLRLMLLDSGFDPASSVAAWIDVAQMLAVSGCSEVSGTNYARKALDGEAVTVSAGTIKIDAADTGLSYAQSGTGFSDALYAILYEHDASDASADVIAYYDFDANKGNKTGKLTLTFSAAGIFTFA